MKKLKNINCFLLDMDGTFYLENDLINGALKFIDLIKKQNKEFVFLTNNSSKNSRDYQLKLKNMGLQVSTEKIITSGEVTASYIKQKKRNARVYIVGTSSLINDFEKYNLNIIKDKNEEIDFLVIGFDTELNYKKLHDAHDLILKGVKYIATNPDKVCPLADGKTQPDCGSIIQLLKTSTGKDPLVIGKPNTLMIDFIMEKLNIKKSKMAMIGDRLYTDIKTAENAKIKGILVLSGETKKSDIKKPVQKPDYIFKSIQEIYEYLK